MVRWIFPNTHIPRSLTMPDTTLLDIPQEEQDQMLAALRRARYGYLLALHVLLLCAAGRNPTDIAAFLFCSRSSVYRIVRLYRARKLGFTVDAEGQLKTKHGLEVSAWTVRRWLHDMGWVWKRAKLVAKDNDPQRVERLARIRFLYEQLRLWETLEFADELDIHLLP